MRKSDPSDSGGRVLDVDATRALFSSLLSLTTDLPETVTLSSFQPPAAVTAVTAPITWAGRTALITGCGPGSIGIELIKALLAGGATVVATSSRFTATSTAAFRKVYQEWGAVGSRLLLFPCNAGSMKDIRGLIEHIYSPSLGLDLDYVVPFAAVGEAGREIEGGLDGASDLAHRIMLTNVLRLIGCVAETKRSRGVKGKPALVLLPLSPNHGVFGGDGLYAESKLGLEALLHKWGSEGWGDYIGIAGAVIGWTRGTGLMAGNNISAEGVEALGGVRTFSQAEMALNLAALLHPRMARLAWESPLWADFRGGFNAVADLKAATVRVRKELEERASLARALSTSLASDTALLQQSGVRGSRQLNQRSTATPSTSPPPVYTRLFDFPPLPSPHRLNRLSLPGNALEGMVHLDSTVCVVGFGEVGPWGNARTRWEIESTGEFSLEGCVLLAWITGRIKWVSSTGDSGGWVEVSTGSPIKDSEVKGRLEAEMLDHAGIRIVEPELFKGYDPRGKGKVFMHAVSIDKDMPWMEISGEEEAAEYRNSLGEKGCDILPPSEGAGPWRVRLRKGAVITVPKSLRFDRWVAGQIPTGWNPVNFGVPADLASRCDPVTLYSLVSTAEALVSAGITDPYEFYAYIHISELGNSAGGGMGGMAALQKIFYGRRAEEDMASDVLQESFINTVPAWINMLIFSSSGPLRTVVGACATAAESVDVAVDALVAGRAKVMVVGGYDDFCEEGSYEFAQMGATSSSATELAAGREPSEACRPMAPSRGGFMEAQGSGIQILTTARLALEMGLPIYGLVAASNTATDKVGRSVPAPGQGVLTTARELPSPAHFSCPPSGSPASSNSSYYSGSSSLVDVAYRRRRLAADLEALASWRKAEEEEASREASQIAGEAEVDEVGSGCLAGECHLSARLAAIAREALLVENSARRRWCSGEFFSRDPTIAPLRGALSVYGLTVDDITVASFHGTGTAANDVNESRVTHTQMSHLGRTPGQPLYVVAQKHLTGHPKGAAAAWMLNGALQMLASGVVPGNSHGDDIDEELRPFTHLAFLSAPLTLGPGCVRSVLLKSFGFGQASGEILLLHPDYLLASLTPSDRELYAQRRDRRERAAGRSAQDILAGKRTLLLPKVYPPYKKEQEPSVYLDPGARASWDPVAGTYTFSPSSLHTPAQGAGVSSDCAPFNSKLSQEASMSATLHSVASSVLRGPPITPQSSGAPAGVGGGVARAAGGLGLGVDVEPLSTFSPAPSPEFASRNFTALERAYCLASADSPSSWAGRWAAKEAVVKALSSAVAAGVGGAGAVAALQRALKGPSHPLIDIEICPPPIGRLGAPVVKLSGAPAELALALGIPIEGGVRLSISHSGDYAVAVAAI